MLDRIILALCNSYYFVFNRKYRLKHRVAQRKIRHARIILEQDYFYRASTQDRGFLLPEHATAIAILHNKEVYLEERITHYFNHGRRVNKRYAQITT